MSKPEDNSAPPDKLAFQALERAVTDVLAHLGKLEDRLARAEARGVELGEVVKRFTGDRPDGGQLLTHIQSLEEENGDLRQRLEEGREGVDRMLARIRFLESQQ